MCTGIKIDYKDGSIIGRTMDYEHPISYNIIYYPREYNYSKDLFARPIHSKYRVLGIGFMNLDPLKDGVNEHGLAGITNAFTGFNLYANKTVQDKVNISSMDYLSYALSNYKNLDELIGDLENIHISTRDARGENVLCPDFHHMFTDKTKRTIVIEPRKSNLVYYDNSYHVMTNSPAFPSHTRRLNRVLDTNNLRDFNSSKDLPGGYDPVSRFIKAFYLREMNVKAHSQKEAFSNFYNILGAMVMPEGFVWNKKYNMATYTRYICGYDTRDKVLTVKSHTNPRVYKLGFEDIKDKDRRQAFFIEDDFQMDVIG